MSSAAEQLEVARAAEDKATADRLGVSVEDARDARLSGSDPLEVAAWRNASTLGEAQAAEADFTARREARDEAHRQALVDRARSALDRGDAA